MSAIFEPSPHRGWLPWAWLAPLICILLVGLSSVPVDFLIEGWGLADAKGNPLTTPAFCLFLLLPFAAMAVATYAWVRFVERRGLATLGLTGAGGLRKFLAGVGFDLPITGLDVHLPALLEKLVPVGPDYLTGGYDGPEGSVLTLALLATGSLLLFVLPLKEPPGRRWR
jgi:hypothetical protein